MRFNEELHLLIKSKYPVICLETIDELYTIRQLKAIAEQLNLTFFQWSLTDGLKRGDKEGSYYQTKEPAKMLRLVEDLLKPYDGTEASPGLFVLKDFEKYLQDVLTLRCFKDLVNRIKGTKNTFVIVSAEYKLPKDIEADSAHLMGGYPVEDEIKTVICETVNELKRTNDKITVRANLEQLDRKSVV